jgi:ABC-type proline/glycine betaine transport system permease subunit
MSSQISSIIMIISIVLWMITVRALLLTLKVFLFISIIGIPIAIMIHKWEEDTLNPVMDKFFQRLAGKG